MVWNTKDCFGNPVTYYEEEDVKKMQDKFRRIESACNDIFTRSKECKSLKNVILSILKSED